MASKRRSSKPKDVVHEADLWGNAVTCSYPQWHYHVLDPIEGHPEMAGREADVARAIRNPDFVRPSTKTGKAFAFESVSTTDTIRVIVYYDNPSMRVTGRTVGVVATAYPDDPTYSSQVGPPIYRKDASKSGTK